MRLFSHLFAAVDEPGDPDGLGDVELAGVLDKLWVQQTAAPAQQVDLLG